MNRAQLRQPDPRLDLVLERIVDVPRELVWLAWTTPEHLKAGSGPGAGWGQGPDSPARMWFTK
ncbi:MAG: hypothetical protein ABI831_02985 [Betaproteobacteria bacterium]